MTCSYSVCMNLVYLEPNDQSVLEYQTGVCIVSFMNANETLFGFQKQIDTCFLKKNFTQIFAKFPGNNTWENSLFSKDASGRSTTVLKQDVITGVAEYLGYVLKQFFSEKPMAACFSILINAF